jgi:hypothetical protein
MIATSMVPIVQTPRSLHMLCIFASNNVEEEGAVTNE